MQSCWKNGSILFMSKTKTNLILAALVFGILNGCATAPKKIAAAPQPPKKPQYQSANDLFKSEQCSKKVERTTGVQPLILKPSVQLLNEDADIFCVQSLHHKVKFLKLTSKLEPLIEANPSKVESKYLSTAFDVVVYDQKMKQRKLAKPIYDSPNPREFSVYYDFSKVKKLPVYVAILFREEDHTKPIFTKIIPPSKDAMTGMNAISGAAGVAMGGFAAGSAASMSQPTESVQYSIYSKNPGEVKAEWVSGIIAK